MAGVPPRFRANLIYACHTLDVCYYSAWREGFAVNIVSSAFGAPIILLHYI